VVKCKVCGEGFGFLELLDGVCDVCRNRQKQECIKDGKSCNSSELNEIESVNNKESQPASKNISILDSLEDFVEQLLFWGIIVGALLLIIALLGSGSGLGHSHSG